MLSDISVARFSGVLHSVATLESQFQPASGFVNGMVASHLLCHSGTINRHSLNGALLS